jgi:predicted KAP-like P-loop ATPase
MSVRNINKYSLTDIPRDVSKGEKDKLGIRPFEDGLTQFIEHANMPITIALQGEWGSGKTSLMNTLRNNLCEGDDARFLDVWINTWEYALMKDATTALVDIVNGMAKNITQFAGNSPTQKLGENILKFGLMAFSAAFNRGSDVVKEILNNGNKSSISEIRAELETVINECKNRDLFSLLMT